MAAGRHLGELLRTGPAEPVSAAAVVAEAAGALTVAHAAGLAHLCLRPSSVWWGAAGDVKVTGLAIAAAAAGIESADPMLADTRGLGRVLYAALTGYTPRLPATGPVRSRRRCPRPRAAVTVCLALARYGPGYPANSGRLPAGLYPKPPLIWGRR